MKSKNSVKLVIVLALVLFLSVGYAVVNSVTLTVTGTAGSVSENIDVYFTGTPQVSNSSKVTATSTSGSLTASIKVSDLTLNETVTATYFITNNERDVGAIISLESITNSNPDYFEVTATINGSYNLCPENFEERAVTVTIKLKKTPITTDVSSANIAVKFKADPTTTINPTCNSHY